MLFTEEHWEPLSKEVSVLVSQRHSFNTDTILLANFSMPKRGEICADFGTGCGTIPLIWCMKSEPKQVYGIELQEEAFQLAQRSVQQNHWNDKIQFLHTDIRKIKELKLFHDIHLVACNPPYQEKGTGIVNADPNLKIARHELECSLEEIIKTASSVLRFGGRFCMCQRPQRLCDAMAMMRKYGMEPKRLRLVQQRKDKAPSIFLIEGKKGGKSGLMVLPTLLVEDENGKFSQEMDKIYGTYAEGHR